MKGRKNLLVTIIAMMVLVFTTNTMTIKATAAESNEIKKIYLQVSQNSMGDVVDVAPKSSYVNQYDVSFDTTYYEKGEKPVINVTVVAKSGYVFYNDFYSSSKFSISGGRFQDGTWVNGTTVKVQIECSKVLKGKLDSPSGLYWEEDYGLASWNSVYDADYYIVSINSNEVNVYDTSANLRPYLKTNKNNKFRVKACSNSSYLSNSSWSEYSDELYYDSDYDYYWDWDNNWNNGWNNDYYGYYDDFWHNNDFYFNYSGRWVKQDNYWYYYTSQGRKATNTILNIDGRSYLFDTNGRMLTGWQSYNGNTYYFYPQGNGNIKEGEMAKGWVLVEGTWYFYDRNTGREVRNQVVEGYYIGSGGNMITSQWIGDKYVDENGRVLVNCWKQINWKGKQRWFYFDGNGNCIKGRIAVIGGLPYPFDGSGELMYGWFDYNGYSYYVKSDGNIARNEYVNNYYWFDDWGRCVRNRY